jgi:perosamine synthetase
MDEIMEIAKEKNIFVIEDCAEAIGTKYNNQFVGSFGDIGCFSFFGNKTITTGEGGMVVTSDKTIMTRAKSLKDQGLAMYREYWHDVMGYNFRMTNICAAIGVAQLQTIEQVIAKKKRIAEWYIQYLEGAPVKLFQGDDGKYGIRNTYWMCTIIMDNPEDRDALRNYMSTQGIETRPTFYPVHTMPTYSGKYQKLVVAEKLGWSGVNLPSYPELEEEDIHFICKQIHDFYGTSSLGEKTV